MKANRGFTLIELMIVVAIIGILATVVMGASTVSPYGYMYSKEVTGVVESVESAIPDGGMMVGNLQSSTVFSSAVNLKLADGTYQSFSTEDRQWAIFRNKENKGKCVRAKIFPYAPINFGKGGTFYGGRLLAMADTCDKLPK